MIKYILLLIMWCFIFNIERSDIFVCIHNVKKKFIVCWIF